MTKTEAYQEIKFQAQIDAYSRQVSKPDGNISLAWKDKPTLASSGGSMDQYRKDIRAFYQARRDAEQKKV